MNLRRLLMLLVLAAASGCSSAPWVQSYEREWLADPLMSFSRDPLSSKYTTHVYEVREAARGGGIGQGGGCGCN